MHKEPPIANLCGGSIPRVVTELSANGWFVRSGAYVLVDGQFGSTGKGALAVLLALAGQRRITVVTTNAGPNSGHTGYMPVLNPEQDQEWPRPWAGDKILTQQIPVASMVLNYLDPGETLCYLNGGAIIDPNKLADEATRFSESKLRIHPCAAIIGDVDREREGAGSGPGKIASTSKGVGSALARKIMREGNVAKIYQPAAHELTELMTLPGKIYAVEWRWHNDGLEPRGDVVLVETAQGFSLGINSPQFYPHTTSRECTVMQAIADARIPAQMVKNVAMCVRLHPIRVGNTATGKSGDCYPDQTETSWEALGVEPELTTVTKRVRRVFTWSRLQFREAVAANRPDTIFANFLNYSAEETARVLPLIREDYLAVIGRPVPLLLGGYGPRPEDVRVL